MEHVGTGGTVAEVAPWIPVVADVAEVRSEIGNFWSKSNFAMKPTC
jgi:hypothetical protein